MLDQLAVVSMHRRAAERTEVVPLAVQGDASLPAAVAPILGSLGSLGSVGIFARLAPPTADFGSMVREQGLEP